MNLNGQGRFAITLDPADKLPGQQAYQGIVSLDGESVATVIENYMLRSEQLDTRLWLAADDKVTRGLSRKAAMASLTVQAHDLLKGFVPAALPLGYASPALVAQGTNRVGPIRQGMNAYTPPGQTPLLSAYTKGTQLLSGARGREGHSMYR